MSDEIYLELANPSVAAKKTHLVIDVFYSKGGTSLFSGRSERRGVYVSVVVVCRDGQFVSRKLFHGKKRLLRELGRASSKALAECRAEVEAQLADGGSILWDMIRQVCAEESVEVAACHVPASAEEFAAAASALGVVLP